MWVDPHMESTVDQKSFLLEVQIVKMASSLD